MSEHRVRFKASEQTAVGVGDQTAARAFYSDVLGLEIGETGHGPQLVWGNLNIWLDVSEHAEVGGGLILELTVEDVEAAREHLTANGCEVLLWEGVGRACIMRDPFGLRFNLWQEPSDQP